MGILHDLKNAGIRGDDATKSIRRGMRPVTTFGDVLMDDSESGLSIGRENPPLVYELRGMGLITDEGPEGEADKTGPTYWVEMQQAIAGETGWDAVLNTVPATDPDGADGAVGEGESPIILATNLPERAKQPAAETTPVLGCHLLDVGTPVMVYVMVDEEGVDRFFFIETPRPTVAIDDSGAGNGAYTGFVVRRPVADISAATNVTAATFGANGPACIIVNSAEIGVADHWLMDAANTNQKTFFGKLLYVNADGTPVIAINAAWYKGCVV